MVRTDITVVESDIHCPTDARLQWDGVCAITRTGNEVRMDEIEIRAKPQSIQKTCGNCYLRRI